jgi:hypothetical protein
MDAQGAMLVLRRVRDLAQKGVLEKGCAERARQIARSLIHVCQNELGDMSLECFDIKGRLADIEERPGVGEVKVRASKGLADMGKSYGVGATERSSGSRLRGEDEEMATGSAASDMYEDEEPGSRREDCAQSRPFFVLQDENALSSNLQMYSASSERERVPKDKKRKSRKNDKMAQGSPDGHVFSKCMRFVRVPVDGLDGSNNISRFDSPGKLQISVR